MRRPGDPKTTHECPAPGCPVRLPLRVLACRPHWYALPRELRDAINAHYRPGQTLLTASPEYLAALARVVEHLNGGGAERIRPSGGEPPPHVRRLRDQDGTLLVRSDEPCDGTCGRLDGSAWRWENRGGRRGDHSDWVCWLDIDAVGYLVDVTEAEEGTAP